VHKQPASPDAEPKRSAHVLCLCLLWALGCTFLFAAFSKLLGFQQFLATLDSYGVGSHAFQLLTGTGVLAAEILLGACMVAGWRPRLALLGICALLLLFITETMVHWSALAAVQCGCFGPLSSSAPGRSLVHQGVLLVLATSLLMVIRRYPGLVQQKPPLKIWMGICGVAASLLLGLFVQPGRASAHMADVPDIQVRAVLSATCSHCRQVAADIRSLQLSADPGAFKVYIGGETSEEIADFLTATGVHLDYVPVTFRQLQRMSAHVPAVQITRNGEVVRNWVGGLPSATEVQTALAEQRIVHSPAE
jgi:uncharacterized membrane protein YphA (DoxX/SURF4 family)